MIERLKNCPQCGGTLNEAGRCEFCGSKVFDFLTIDFNDRNMPSAKTYIRLKVNGKIVLAPVIVSTAKVSIKSDDPITDFYDGRQYIHRTCFPEIELDLMVIGEMIQIDEGGAE